MHAGEPTISFFMVPVLWLFPEASDAFLRHWESGLTICQLRKFSFMKEAGMKFCSGIRFGWMQTRRMVIAMSLLALCRNNFQGYS
jgi:hypothetical protein